MFPAAPSTPGGGLGSPCCWELPGVRPGWGSSTSESLGLWKAAFTLELLVPCGLGRFWLGSPEGGRAPGSPSPAVLAGVPGQCLGVSSRCSGSKGSRVAFEGRCHSQ